jgi:hypothetical protein
MARPQPTVICSNDDDGIISEICEADAVYAVLYQGQPIKLRRHNSELMYLGYKYSKTMFPEPGHAFVLARKLNAIHNTDDFTVAVMTVGRTISQ